MQLSSVYAILVLAHMSSAWVRFREPQSRRNFLNQTLIEKLQNCAGKEIKQCGLCGEGPGEIQTNIIPTQNYTVVDPDVRVLAVELGFRAGLNGHLEFRICNVTNDSMADGIACNETTPLLIGSDVKWFPSQTQSSAKSRFRLPRGLVCERCVLQVKYTPGPESTMKDFRFFDCTLLNITHPTKVSIDTVGISREKMLADVFPPDHSILDGSHISAEIRSSGKTAGEGTDFIQSMNRTFTSAKNRLTVDGNRIDSTKHGGSTFSVRRLPLGERTASLNIKKMQSAKNEIMNPEVTNVLSNGTINDRRVVITTKIFNMTNSNSNVGDPNVHNRARITMIDIVPNNEESIRHNRAAESELNRTEVVTNVIAQPTTIDTRVGMFNVSRNGLKSTLNNSGNLIIVNETSIGRSNVETAISENIKTNGSSELDMNRALVRNANSRILATNKETVVGKTSQNATVDWKIYNGQPIFYDEYYFYNGTGAINDTYYYDDFNSETNNTFVSNLVDTVAVNSNASNEGLLIKSANNDIVNTNITGQTVFSIDNQGENVEIQNRNFNSSATFNTNTAGLDNSKSLSKGLELQRNSTNIKTNGKFYELGHSDGIASVKSNASINSTSIDSIEDTRTVLRSNMTDVGESVVRSLAADTNKNMDRFGPDTKAHTFSVIYSGVSRDRDFMGLNSRFGKMSEIQNNHMITGLDRDSREKIKSKEENVKTKAYAGKALTNQKENKIVIKSEGGSSSHMFKTSGSGLEHSSSSQTPEILDKNSLINETVRMMAILSERPTKKLNSVDAVRETFKRDVNSSVYYTESDVQIDKVNQQVVNVPHTIIVLPKYKTVPYLGQTSDIKSFGFMSEQKTQPLQENQTVHQDDVISGNQTYTYQEHAPFLELYNVTHNHKTQGNLFQTADEKTVTPSSRNVTVGVNTTPHRNYVADITAGKRSGFSNDALKRTSENASLANGMKLLEEITYYNHDEMFFPTSPNYQFIKRLSYSISAADRRPNYANMDIVSSAVESSSRNSSPSIQSSGNRSNNVLLNTVNTVKTEESNGDIQENLQTSRKDLFSSGTKVVISKDASSQSINAVNNNTEGNGENTWGPQSSKTDINNRLNESVSSTEPVINFSIPHIQEPVISTDKTLISDISTQGQDRFIDINFTKVKQATTADTTGYLDISTRAYDMYIGLVSTTVEPLSHSPFVRVVNYSTFAADSIFPAPKQVIRSSSDVVSSAQSQANTESFLMSIFSSTPSPTASASVPEEASISTEGNIPPVAQEPLLIENSNLFENVNFLTDSNADVDHLGGVPIHSIPNRTFGGRLDLASSVSRNDRNRHIVGNQILSSFDISNRLDGKREHLTERNSNEVIWKAAVRGSAIPVGILTTNPNLQTHNNVSVGRHFPENNQTEFTGNVFLKKENQSSFSNNNGKIVKNVTIEKAIVWQSMPMANFSKSDKTNIEINEWHSKPVQSLHRINSKDRSTLDSIRINSLSKSDRMANDVSMVHSTPVDNLTTSGEKKSYVDVVHLNPFSESNRSDKAETSTNVFMTSEKGSDTNRNYDIFINGNAAINKVASIKNKDVAESITGIMNTPEVMPPIEVNSQNPSVTFKTRNAIDLVQNEMPKKHLLHTTRTNITLFSPYAIGTDVTNRNNRWQLQKEFHTSSSGLRQNVDYVTEAVDKSSDALVAKNLSVSAIWDINRGNTDGNVNRRNANEIILTEPIPIPSESNSDVLNPYTVFRQNGSNAGTKQNIKQLVNTTKISKEDIAVENQIQSDVNRQVLRTLEALVLELEAMKMKGSASRRPVVDSSLYSQTNDRSLNRNRIHSSYPVFSVHPNLLTLPSEFINEQNVQRNSRGLRGSENHKLMNVIGISNQRDWNSNITLNSSISTKNINNTMFRNSPKQQIVNLSEVRSKSPDEFATLLNTFADVSSTRSQPELNPSVVKLMDYTEQFLQKTDASQDTLSMAENSGRLTEATKLSDNKPNLSETKQQTVITADSSTFINPFTGERMHLSKDGMQFADKFIVRGTGNLQHLQGVDSIFSPNFTVGRYNYIPIEGLNNDSVSIQGKYLVGAMRRNEMGQFEPVPLASKLEVPLTDKKPPSTNIKLTQEKTNNISTMNTNSSVYTGLPAHALVNTVRETNDKPASKLHNIVLFNVTTEAASNLEETSKKFVDNSNGVLMRTSDQEVVINGQDHTFSNKLFYNQEDLLRTNRISLNQTKPLTGRPLATRKIASDFKAYDLSCKDDEMFVCKAVGKNSFIPGMVWWCFSHCKSGVCPPEKCSCRCENILETSNIKRLDSDNSSGLKRRKKVIQLTLNTPSNGSVRASEEQKSKSKSELVLKNIIRPKVLNATVSSLNKTHTFLKGNDNIKTVQLFDTPTVKCKGINAFANTTGIDELCTKICSQNMCPETICMCFG